MILRVFFLLVSFYLCVPAYCAELSEINLLKDYAYRVGTSDEPELKYTITETINTQIIKKEENILDEKALTYADLSIKKMSKEISQNLEMNSELLMADLSLLWQGAAINSDTIKFALYKLSNPDADKPDEKSIKKVLSTIANMSTLVGAGMGNPFVATGAFLGGNLLGIASSDDKIINYKFSRVNDADMIILVKKINDLQQNIVNVYYDYMKTRKLFDMTVKYQKTAYQNYVLASSAEKEVLLIADAYYRSALDKQMKARSDFYSARATMEQLVGKETFQKFEEIVNSREQ